MKKRNSVIKNIFFSFLILLVSFIINYALHKQAELNELISTVFIFAVFIISLITDGYIYGILSALISVLLVNYFFEMPYSAFNFTATANIFSAVVMIIISLLTCTLTKRIKKSESSRAETEKERMRANLLRAVSHDIRTPLTTIYGSASTLIEEDLDETKKKQILNGIKEDSQWLLRMVENLLSITKIDSGNVKIIKTPTVLEELIDSVVLKFKKRYPTKEVEIEIPEDLILIPMDAILIEQVLVNILENAVQHAVGMTKVSLKVFLRGNNAVFEIEDDGCGIDRERLENIFSGFFNKEEGADSRKKNAGIGLSVCATIINAHGGKITAENTKTGGALFRFTLSTEHQNGDSEQI